MGPETFGEDSWWEHVGKVTGLEWGGPYSKGEICITGRWKDQILLGRVTRSLPTELRVSTRHSNYWASSLSCSHVWQKKDTWWVRDGPCLCNGRDRNVYQREWCRAFTKAQPCKSNLFPSFVLCPSFLSEGTKQTTASRHSFVIVIGRRRFDAGWRQTGEVGYLRVREQQQRCLLNGEALNTQRFLLYYYD